MKEPLSSFSSQGAAARQCKLVMRLTMLKWLHASARHAQLLHFKERVSQHTETAAMRRGATRTSESLQ